MSVNVKFTGDAKQLEAAQKRAVAAIQKFEEKSGKALNKLTGDLLKGRGAMVALAGSATFLKGAIAAAVDFEKLNLGLRAVADESENVEEHIARLKQLAKEPGLGFEQAQKGSIKLQGVGFQIQQTEEILKQFGNAVALSGNGAPELERITTQLGQLAAKGKVLTQDLRPVIEAAPVVSRALKQAFGTVNADDIGKEVSGSQEFIERLLVAMQDLPRAPKSAAESFQNMKDSAKAALAEVGAPVVKELVPVLDSLVQTLDENEETLKSFGKSLAFVITTAGKLSPIIGALATAYVAFKAAQLGGNLGAKIKAQVLSIRDRTTALKAETTELAKNTAAERANAAARSAPNFRGAPKATAATLKRTRAARTTYGEQLPDSLAFALAAAMDEEAAQTGKTSARAWGSAFAKSINTQGGALGVAAIGAISTSFLDESKLIGGKSGSSMLDGISGALALAGPAGIVASLGIQAAKAGYALGVILADKMSEALYAESEAVAARPTLTADFKAAVAAGDEAAAVAALNAEREELNNIIKTGDDLSKEYAKTNLQVLDLYEKNLSKRINQKKEELRIERELAAERAKTPPEFRADYSQSLREELALLKAQVEQDERSVRAIEQRQKIRKIMARLEKEGVSDANERYVIANKILSLQIQKNKIDKENLQTLKAKEQSQKNMQSLIESSLDAYKSTLPIAQQLELLAKQRADLQKSGGGGEALDIFKRADQARKSGKVEEAERLYKIGKKLLDLDKERSQLETDAASQKDAKQNKADSEAEFKLQQELLKLKLGGDEKAIAAKEREIALLQETQAIESQLGITRKAALALANARLDIQEKITAAEKAEQTKKKRGDFATDLKILELEASGRKKEADALREKADILSRAKDLQEQLNLSAQKALELAQKEAAYKKQIQQNGSASSAGSRRRGITRDSSGFGSRSRSVIDRVKRSNDGDLTQKIRKNAAAEKAAQAHRNDPSLQYLAKMTAGNEEMIKIWRNFGVV